MLVILVCDRLCITHSFSVTSANIAINKVSLKRLLKYLFRGKFEKLSMGRRSLGGFGMFTPT